MKKFIPDFIIDADNATIERVIEKVKTSDSANQILTSIRN